MNKWSIQKVLKRYRNRKNVLFLIQIRVETIFVFQKTLANAHGESSYIDLSITLPES